MPPVALAYGAVFLDERISFAAIAGLVLILTGVALGTGRKRRAGARGTLDTRVAAAPSNRT